MSLTAISSPTSTVPLRGWPTSGFATVHATEGGVVSATWTTVVNSPTGQPPAWATSTISWAPSESTGSTTIPSSPIGVSSTTENAPHSTPSTSTTTSSAAASGRTSATGTSTVVPSGLAHSTVISAGTSTA